MANNKGIINDAWLLQHGYMVLNDCETFTFTPKFSRVVEALFKKNKVVNDKQEYHSIVTQEQLDEAFNGITKA